MHPQDGIKLYLMLKDMLQEFEEAIRQAQGNGGIK